MRSFARTVGATVFGARARLVDIQVSVCGEEEGGERVFRIVGLPDSALREGRERIRSAVAHEGWPWPHRPVTVNLAPAAARKEGAALDLPIALGVLGAQGVLGPPGALRDWLVLGELGLDGAVRPVRGVLAAVEAARRQGLERALVPRANAEEAAAVAGVQVFAVGHLVGAVGHLRGVQPLTREAPRRWTPEVAPRDGPPAVRGQDVAVQAAMVAAVGRHNLLLWGPPGAGKTLLAREIVRWLSPLTYEEALEVSRVHSIGGLLEGGLLRSRPFRAPHHTTSLAGLVGGGSIPRPGEISLAHLGVLFLDELAEFPRPSLEALRQPLEDGRLVVGRVAGRATFPADVLLVAATNPCPCGWYGEKNRCRCTAREVARYRARVSGPLRDRFDLQVRVRPVDAARLVEDAPTAARTAWQPREREQAWRAQARRARRWKQTRDSNARLPGALLPQAIDPAPTVAADVVRHARRLGLTGRGVHRLLRVARTIADLNGCAQVEGSHVFQAISYRGD